MLLRYKVGCFIEGDEILYQRYPISRWFCPTMSGRDLFCFHHKSHRPLILILSRSDETETPVVKIMSSSSAPEDGQRPERNFIWTYYEAGT